MRASATVSKLQRISIAGESKKEFAMPKKSLLDSIDVPAPCPKSWDEMIGDDKTRFCENCEKDIYNISAMTRREARKLLFQSNEKVCIRLEKDTDGRVRTLKKQLHKITRQAPIAAGVLSASLTFSALTHAQGDAVIGTNSATIFNKQKDKTSNASISGTVSDQSGAVVPNAQITLRDTKSSAIRNTSSTDKGFYEFKNVEKSVYEIEVKATGFNNRIYTDIFVDVDKNNQLQITLNASNGTITVGIYEELPKSLPFSDKLKLLKESKSNNQQDKKTSQISFTIYDQTLAVIPEAKVLLINQKSKEEFTVSTNQEGVAQFNLIPHGKYDLEVSSRGFNKYKQVIQIKEQIEPNIKITLDVGVTTGVIVVDWSEIPLFRAIAQDDNETVKQLINSGFNLNTKDTGGETALHVAVQHENLEMVRFLLDEGAKVNVKDKSKRTPLLMLDESFGDDDKAVVEIVRLLISKGADVNVQNTDKETLLMMACDDENIEVVKMLLAAGANPNLKDEDGDTVLSMTSSEEIKQILRQYGARE